MLQRSLYAGVLLWIFTVCSGWAADTLVLPPPPRPLEPVTTESGEVSKVSSTTRKVESRSTTKAENVSSSDAKQKPEFVVSEPKIRPLNGYYVGVYGGINALQGGDWTKGGAGLNEKSNIYGTAGFKTGYTWFLDDEPIDQFYNETGGFHLGGGLEFDASWVGTKLEANTESGRAVNVDLDAAVLMTNFLLKAQAGRFRPYVGPGVGAALISTSGYRAPGVTTDKSDFGVALAIQGIAGCDYFLSPEWSLFGEYRYLVFHDVKLYSGANKLNLNDLNQHLFQLGIKHSF